MAEEDKIEIFEESDEKDEISEPLVTEPYTYDNIINNPLLKPISEADRSIQDLEDMITKKLTDSNRDKLWVNSVMGDVPAYNDSPFIARLIKLAQNTQDVIKLQDIQIKNYRNCIKEMFDIALDKFVMKIESEEGDEKYVEPETIIPEGSYEKYLQKIVKSENEKHKEVAEKILENYKNDKVTKDEKERFTNACNLFYGGETDNKKRSICAHILRMNLDERR